MIKHLALAFCLLTSAAQAQSISGPGFAGSTPTLAVTGAGAASTPPILASGTWFTGGTGTTTKPALLIEPAGTPSTAWQTTGTGLGVNAPSGFTGRFYEYQLNGVTVGYLRSDGFQVATNVGATANLFGLGNTSSLQFGGASDTIFSRKAAANWQLGAADAAAPVAQTLSTQSVVAGTTNTAGQNLTVQGSTSTGSGIPGKILLQTGGSGAAATAQNTQVTALAINSGIGAGTIQHTVFVVSSLPSCPTVGAGSEAFVTDATAPTYNTALTGGGAVGIPVFCDGTIWKAH